MFELRSGSMSQSDLDEELSRSSRIQHGVSDVWCAWCGNDTSARGPAWRWLFRYGAVGSSADLCQRKTGVGRLAIVCA
jgi:hypothetical protein